MQLRAGNTRFEPSKDGSKPASGRVSDIMAITDIRRRQFLVCHLEHPAKLKMDGPKDVDSYQDITRYSQVFSKNLGNWKINNLSSGPIFKNLLAGCQMPSGKASIEDVRV